MGWCDTESYGINIHPLYQSHLVFLIMISVSGLEDCELCEYNHTKSNLCTCLSNLSFICLRKQKVVLFFSAIIYIKQYSHLQHIRSGYTQFTNILVEELPLDTRRHLRKDPIPDGKTQSCYREKRDSLIRHIPRALTLILFRWKTKFIHSRPYHTIKKYIYSCLWQTYEYFTFHCKSVLHYKTN